MDSNKGGSIDASGQVLVDCGVGSRSQVKTFLKKKQVTVNGQVETSPKTQIVEG